LNNQRVGDNKDAKRPPDFYANEPTPDNEAPQTDFDVLSKGFAANRPISPQSVLNIQRTLGNQAVLRMLGKTSQPAPIQRKISAVIMRTTVDFLEEDVDRRSHTMAGKHAWDRFVVLVVDEAANYKLVQPFLQQTVDTGTGKNLGRPNVVGQPMEFTKLFPGAQTKTGNPETIAVKGIKLAGQDVFKVGDAWVVTR